MVFAVSLQHYLYCRNLIFRPSIKSLKVFEISSDVGFSHAKYFGQVFKQEVGQTPAQYQKMIQRK